MTQYLHDYFSGHATQAIEGMKAALQATSFYKRLEMRLSKGEDLSGELPVIAQVGNAGALDVVQQAIAENKALQTSVWDLPPKVQALGKVSLDMHKEPFEHLPRVTQTLIYKCPAGAVTVTVLTAGENFKVEFTTEKSKMAAEMTMRELEKEISFALLSA
jgi:membrane-bound inhibitor of C-type lysozyme